MDRDTFEKVDPLLDKLAESTERLLNSSEISELRGLLTKLGKILGERYTASLSLTVDVFDRVRERSLPVLQTGLTGFDQDEPYRFTDDCSPQKYVVDGEMQVVPHDRCPKCWGVWDFKFDRRSCRECGATLGKDVKLLLDADVCPNCEEGKVSLNQPRCPDCGYEVDVNLVVWG